MGLDGSVAVLVTETLCTALRPFECCPIASENCTLLIEMAKFAALSSEKTVHLDLKGFNFPLRRKTKKSSSGDSDKIMKNNEVEVEVEDKSSRYVEEDMADEEEDDSREGGEGDEDLRVDTAERTRYEAPVPSKASKASHLNYPFSVYPDREPSRFLSSGSDSIFLGGTGVTGLLNLEGSPRMQKGGPPLLRSEKGRTSLFFPPPPADPVHDTHVHASDHADVHNNLKGQGHGQEQGQEQEQGQGQSFSDKGDSDYLTVADLPNYCVPEAHKRGSAEKPVVIDKRTEDQLQFSLIGNMQDPLCASSFLSISIEEKEKEKEKEGGKSKTKIKEFVASKGPLNHESIDADDSSDAGSIDVDMEDIIASSNARTSGRTVSFDETASSAEADNFDHERIHSPRFDPPLSPPPHHADMDTDEVPTNGHSLESSPYCADTSDRVIVFSTAEPVKATNQPQPQPLSLSPTRTGSGSTVPHTAPHSQSPSDKYATQMKLRARAEKELMKRGNHVAFEAERENENENNDAYVEDEAQLFRNSLLQNSDTNMNTNINSSHYYDSSSSSSAYPASALSHLHSTTTSTSYSHSHSDSRTNEEIKNADGYGVGSEDAAVGRTGDRDRDRVKEATSELCDDDEHEVLDRMSHVHPQSHPAHGAPPLNADGSLNLTRNPILNKMLTRSLEDVAKIYSSSLTGTGTGTGSGLGTGAVVGEYGAQFSRNKSDEHHPLPQSRSLSKSSSMNDLDRKREIVEKERASLRRSYEELGGRGSGSGSGSDDEDRRPHVEHREGHHTQYDSLSGEGEGALGGDGDSGLLFQGSSTHSDAMKHKQKGLHVHIKDIEVEEIPDHVFSPCKVEKDIPRDLHAGELDDIYGNHGSAGQASPRKAKSRRKKKGKKDTEKDVAVVHRALHAPKHITGKFTDIRASQDFKTGIYRSTVRDPILSSLPPPNPYLNPSRRFSEVHRRVPETSSSLSPVRTRNPISRVTVAGSSGPYGLVRHSIGGPTASTKSKPSLPLRGKSPLTRPATATATATATAGRKRHAPIGPGKGKERGKGRACSSSGSTAVVSAPVLGNAVDGDLTRKSVAVHVPSAIFAALSPLSQNYSDEEVEAEVEAEAEDGIEERNERKLPNKQSHLLSPHFTQHNTSENVYQTHQDQSARPSRGLVRCPSPYSPAAASRSGSPILRTRSKSRESYKKDPNVQIIVGGGGGPRERREEFESEVETEDFSNDSSDSTGSPQSQYHLKDGNLRPKSAKGRRRSSENSSPHPSPSVLDPFRYQGQVNAQTFQGDEQEGEEKHQNYFNRSAQQSATAHAESPISSMYSPNMNISKHAGRGRDRERDQLESFSSLHFSRDAAFSQSLREVISQSVEGSFKKLLGPSFKSLLLGHATAQSIGRVTRKKSLSPASPSHMSRDRDRVFLRGRESPEGPFLHHRDRGGSHEPTASQQRQRIREARYLLEDKALGELDGIHSSDDHWTANGHLKATKSSRGASSSARILKDDVTRASSSSTVPARPLPLHSYRTALDRPSPSDAVSSPSPHKPLAKRFPASAATNSSAGAGALRGCLKSKGKTKRKETIEYV